MARRDVAAADPPGSDPDMALGDAGFYFVAAVTTKSATAAIWSAE